MEERFKDRDIVELLEWRIGRVYEHCGSRAEPITWSNKMNWLATKARAEDFLCEFNSHEIMELLLYEE